MRKRISGAIKLLDGKATHERFIRNQRPGVVKIVTASADETQSTGKRLGEAIGVPGVVLLSGALGSGKTTLARGIAAGLGLKDLSLVNSPSFTLVNTYQARCPIYHVDLYRLKGSNEIASIGLDEFMGREGITIVEWSERLADAAEAAVSVELEDAGGDSRIIRISFLDTIQQRRFHGMSRPERLP